VEFEPAMGIWLPVAPFPEQNYIKLKKVLLGESGSPLGVE
jgi:hypothetical protein